MGCKWIYIVNKGLTKSNLKRFKARFVAKGYTQKEWLGFKEVFSPVVRHASIITLLALITIYDLELE